MSSWEYILIAVIASGSFFGRIGYVLGQRNEARRILREVREIRGAP